MRQRTPLFWMRQAIERGCLTVGFIGGSITDAKKRFNWPEPVIAWLSERYPQLRIKVENTAISATGSDLGVFRAERDLLSRNCDIVFIEYAVNDYHVDSLQRGRSREGLVRKLLAQGQKDIVLTYTFNQDMYDRMITDETPESIKEFEELAEHYRLNSVWMGMHALQEVKSGRMKWDEWLPDGLHPGSRGSLSYAQSVISLLESDLSSSAEHNTNPPQGLPGALHEGHWQNSFILPWENVFWESPWTMRRWPYSAWMDEVLFTSAVGARLSFEFVGTGVALGQDFGKYAADFKWRIDQGKWKTYHHERPDWCPDRGWPVVSLLTEELESGKHQLEIEVIHGNTEQCKGSDFALVFIGCIAKKCDE